jgi:flagellar basal body-associated protein FliL
MSGFGWARWTEESMKLAVKIPLAIAVVLLQLVAAWFLVNWMLDKQLGDSTEGGPPPQEEAPPEKAYEYGQIFYLTDMVINPKGSVGRRLFKISLALEYDPANTRLADELNQRTPFMRDYLISYLGSMNEDSLSDISYREVMRDSLSTALNRFLTEGQVDRVLFQDFIRQ